ncbi:hypothetical protein IEO21_04987 [Rhodonia placenta]|uniref:Uncharacterized protein n=1 Tax=Rhodonia placenta TaxID=104341 RepID=A0A8H7P2P3_9APHY|nr:hypothetical protein IEO21_04987 [Postia placenta]
MGTRLLKHVVRNELASSGARVAGAGGPHRSIKRTRTISWTNALAAPSHRLF